MTNGEGPDEAVLRGLAGAGCRVTETSSIAQTLEAFHGMPEGEIPLLVAEVQAGAMPLLALLRDRGVQLPPTLLLDRQGTDIYAPIKALEFGVKAYVLASQPPIERELTAQLTAERLADYAEAGARSGSADAGEPPLDGLLAPPLGALQLPAAAALPADFGSGPDATAFGVDFDWDPIAHVIRVSGKYIHLSPIEGRIFELLLRNRGRTVPLHDFMRYALKNAEVSEKIALEQLRPHIMRLRRKLAAHSNLAERVVNTRGSGYMLM
jgi:DNA-binding response OmpR family regulator